MVLTISNLYDLNSNISSDDLQPYITLQIFDQILVEGSKRTNKKDNLILTPFQMSNENLLLPSSNENQLNSNEN
jgi:hypothetical protein